MQNSDAVSLEMCKLAKEAQKIVRDVKVKLYKEACEKLNNKKIERNVYKIARIRTKV